MIRERIALTAVSESVSMTIWARVAAEHWFGLVAGTHKSWQYEFDVVVIDEGHECVVLINC